MRFLKPYYFYILPLALTVGLYGLLFGIYTMNNIDNPWTGAWIYNFYKFGITYDHVFCDGASSCWGVRFFSQIYAYLYGSILALTGFSLHKGLLISYSLIILGLINWFCIATSLLKNKKLSFMFVILLALSGPILNAANETRVDALVFFLMSASLLLWIKQKHFFSLFIAFMAVETHPIGGITFFYLLAYFLCYNKVLILKPRFLFTCSAGILCGIALYLFFHYSEIHSLPAVFKEARDADVNNFIYAFFYRDHKLQFRENVVIFVAALILYLIRFKRREFYYFLTVFLVMLSSFVFTRANWHYIAFVYPAFWLFTIYIFSYFRVRYFKLEYLFVLILLLNTNHYLHVAKRHHAARQFNQYIAEIKSLNLPMDRYIYSNPIDYYAFYTYPKFRAITNDDRHDPFYLLEHIDTVFVNDKYHFDQDKWIYKKIKTLRLKSGGIINVYEGSRK